jgi:malate dehydrogenase (oxaloacetate-decarboxylating)
MDYGNILHPFFQNWNPLFFLALEKNKCYGIWDTKIVSTIASNKEHIMDQKEKAIKMHREWNGKLVTNSKAPVKDREALAIAYTPGVAEPCKIIAENPAEVYNYTIKANTVAVVSDGSAVLGLGNIGAYAAMPVMEGKCVLFKEFADVNAVPICLDTQDTEEIIATVKNIAPCFGGINLEDISAPRCFEIEERLKGMLDIPVFHDDQHGTAIVVLAGIINGLKVTGKKKEDCKVVVNGAGSAGVAITKLLLTYGFPNVTMCDREGIIGPDYPNLNWMQQEMAKVTNLSHATGTLADALRGADIFVGVSAPGIVTPEMVASMNRDSILFAMANPVPEIMPDAAKAAGARIVGTGRSDFPNQVNNVVAFPGIFRGALEGHAKQITEEMKLAAAEAIAGLVSPEQLCDEFIMPEAFDPRVADVVSQAVKDHIRA